MSRAIRLYKGHTIEELAGMFEGIKPEQKKGSIWLYSAKQRKLSDDIARAIQWHMDDKRKAAQQ